MLELHEHTKISGSDGRELGEVASFVVDPGAKTLTHVIVERGAVFPEDRIVPVEALEETDAGVQLKPGVNPSDLPEFTSSNYLETDPTLDPGWPTTFIWAYPIPVGAGFPAYPHVPNVDAGTTRRLAQNEVIVDEGADVVSADGTKVGSITQVAVAEDGTLSHIVVNPGFFKDERMIPSHWISEVGDNEVVLALTDKTLTRHDLK